ncbi:MAG: YicC/YloC family endoribonuclease [Steroidobacteraceae bacterium]
MIRSMTGFARSELTLIQGVLSWELRSVNHRYLEISLRLPDELRSLEGDLRQAINTRLRRGKVDATLVYRADTGRESSLELNEPLLDRLVEQVGRVRRRTGDIAGIDAMELLRWPGVVRETERDLSPLQDAAVTLLNSTLEQLCNSRASEGARLKDLMLARCQGISALVTQVSARLPEVRERIRARLLDKLSVIAVAPNQERFEQELVLALQRMDVDEELDRLQGHVSEVLSALDGDEAVGRRLDFLMQELNREANTLSSKSQDLETTRAAVEIKVLIEQLREQVQNVE